MGKNYYCDYCDKRMKDDSSIKKKHIEGLAHQKARNEHYAQFKTAEEILRDEQKKKPCAKFPIGNCQFGAMCRFSHYTPEELATINAKVEYEQRERASRQGRKTYSKCLIDDFMKRRKIEKEKTEAQFLEEFFNYPEELKNYKGELPPSLQPIDVESLRDFKPKFFG